MIPVAVEYYKKCEQVFGRMEFCFKSQVLLALKMKVYFGRRSVVGRQAYSSEIDIGNSTLFLQTKVI